MSTTTKPRITIGSRVRITEDVEMTHIIYHKGHEFTVTGWDGLRGMDLKDDDGNELVETRMIHHIIELIPDQP